jgi:hypothetical protein
MHDLQAMIFREQFLSTGIQGVGRIFAALLNTKFAALDLFDLPYTNGSCTNLTCNV